MSNLGANNKLGFIKTYDSLESINDDTSLINGRIIIDYSQVDPKLKYLKEVDGEKVWITIDGSDSPINSALISDLEYQLRKRDWNITERIFTNKYSSGSDKSRAASSTTTMTPTTTTVSPSIDDNDDETEDLFLYVGSKDLKPIPNRIEYTSSFKDYIQISETYNEDEINSFNEIYEELIVKKQMKEYNSEQINLGTQNYFNIISARDLNSGTSVVDLISLTGSTYTSTLNLNQVFSNLRLDEGTNCLLVVGVQYTFDRNQYIQELSFPIIEEKNSINSDQKYTGQDFISKIKDKVTVDFHDGCLRVFPESDKVTECIIGYCYINYDGLF